jgi:flagellar assembly protein FliH
MDTSNARPFSFETEFTPDGDVLRGPQSRYVPRAEVEQLAASARAEGEMHAKQTAFASVDNIVSRLAPVSAQLAAISDSLRREAAELALAAARKIAGHALDANGVQIATDAIAEAVKMLKLNPTVTVNVAPEAIPEVTHRLEELRKQGRAGMVLFIPDHKARPGDWSVEWAEGSVGFSREDVEAAIAAVIEARLEDPVEPQLNLFSAA